jgi:antitoxin component HigA of HigAB toxin-antitoxin module
MSAITIKPTKRLTARYLELIQEFPLSPMQNKAQLKAATAIIDRLAPVADDVDHGETDYLYVLSDLVDAYEREHDPNHDSDASGIEVLRSLMQEHDMNQKTLAKKLKVSDTAVSLILCGERRITADHARSLGKIFSVDPGLFL